MQRILVVDDEPYNLEIIDDTLSTYGYTLELFPDGASAWERLQQQPPFDLAIIDKMMPHPNGDELLQLIREHPQLHTLPIIVVSAAAYADDIRHALALGANQYLTRPFQSTQLIDAVTEILSPQQ